MANSSDRGYPKTVTMSTNPNKLGTTTPAETPRPSRGRDMYQDIHVDKRDGGPQPDTRTRPGADDDYFGSIERFKRTELSSRPPNRNQAGEPTRKK